MARPGVAHSADRNARSDASAPAHLGLALALERVGRLSEAASAFAAALASQPRSCEAHRGLARVALALNDPRGGFLHADRAVALDEADPENWLVFAEALRAADQLVYAAKALECALMLDPARAAAQGRLGQIYQALDRPADAAARFLDAVRLDPADKASHVNLSSLYGRAGQFARARAHAEAALALDPDFIGAHQNLAVIAESEGREDEARIRRERAYRACPLFVVRAARPVRRVLILASAERANSPDDYLLPAQRYDRLVWFIGYADPANAALPDYDVVFNAIGDPDASEATADRIEEFLETCARPVLNPPDRVARARRDLATELFADIPGLIVPATRRVSAEDCARSLPLSFSRDRASGRPLLIRPVGAHGGEGLVRLEPGEAAPALAPRAHYLTEFHDFRSPDGLYRKYRMFFVAGEPFPYHLAIGERWLLHYQSSATADFPERIAEERRFLEDPAAALGATAYAAIGEVGRRLALDFAGVDFALAPDGRALLFEANAAMLAHPEPEDGPLAHKNPHVRRIFAAFWDQAERGR